MEKEKVMAQNTPHSRGGVGGVWVILTGRLKLSEQCDEGLEAEPLRLTKSLMVITDNRFNDLGGSKNHPKKQQVKN